MPNIADSASIPVLISIFSGLVSLLSLSFAVYSWRQAQRSLVFARVTTMAGGNSGIALTLLVENTGNRPARDIQLIVKVADVQAASSQSSIPNRNKGVRLQLAGEIVV